MSVQNDIDTEHHNAWEEEESDRPKYRVARCIEIRIATCDATIFRLLLSVESKKNRRTDKRSKQDEGFTEGVECTVVQDHSCDHVYSTGNVASFPVYLYPYNNKVTVYNFLDYGFVPEFTLSDEKNTWTNPNQVLTSYKDNQTGITYDFGLYWDGACSAEKIMTYAPKGMAGFVLGSTLLFGKG